MSINFRKPNGYYITRFKYELKDMKTDDEKNKSKNGTESSTHDKHDDDTIRLIYNGSFRESTQKSIDIFLDDYTFESFEALLVYADSGRFDRDGDVDHYINLIQLARLWLYDELVDILESHLTTCITIDSITNLHTLANIMELDTLRNECIKVEKLLDSGVGSLSGGWGRCPLANHQTHHYSNCYVKKVNSKEPEVENWDEEEYS